MCPLCRPAMVPQEVECPVVVHADLHNRLRLHLRDLADTGLRRPIAETLKLNSGTFTGNSRARDTAKDLAGLSKYNFKS